MNKTVKTFYMDIFTFNRKAEASKIDRLISFVFRNTIKKYSFYTYDNISSFYRDVINLKNNLIFKEYMFLGAIHRVKIE